MVIFLGNKHIESYGIVVVVVLVDIKTQKLVYIDLIGVAAILRCIYADDRDSQAIAFERTDILLKKI